jgi:hypothetical protein
MPIAASRCGQRRGEESAQWRRQHGNESDNVVMGAGRLVNHIVVAVERMVGFLLR